jgi:transposase InsO family protein
VSVNELWLTANEVAEITGWVTRTVRRHAVNDHLRYKLADSKAENGKRERVYAASSLPAEFQPKLLDLCIRKAAGDQALQAANAWVDDGVDPSKSTALAVRGQQSLFNGPILMMQSPDLADLSDDQRETARARFAIVSSLLEWRDGGVAPFRTQDGREIRTFDDFVSYHAATQQVAPRTVYKWLARYDNGGATPLQKFKALADRGRADRGVSRSLAKFPIAAEFALIKYLGLAPSRYLEAARELRLPEQSGLDYTMPRYHSERLSISQVYEGIEREWPNWYNHGSKPPSYTTISTFVKSIPECIKVWAREGEEAYENRCEPHLKRKYDMPVNSIWNSDHRILDVFGWNDYFPEFLQERGSWMRVWITTIEDMRSRRILGWCFSVNPSSRSVAAAMRMAAERYGFPGTVVAARDGSIDDGVFYVDNGKDYKLWEKTLQENFGLRCQRTKTYRGRSKPIESWHSIMSKHFDPIFGPAYAGKDAKDRNEENTLALRQHKLWREGKVGATPLPPVSHVIEMFGAWVENEYNEHEHGGHNMQGLSPRVIFDRELPAEKRKPVDVAQMEPLFWQRVTRKVINSQVDLFKQKFEAADAESAFQLRLYNGRDVRIACNPDDIAVALCYEEEGPDHRFIGRLRAQQMLAHNPVSRDAVATMERENARFKKGLKSFERTLSRRALAAGIATEADSLAARAAVNAPRPVTAQSITLAASNAAPALGPAVPSAADAAKRFLSQED